MRFLNGIPFIILLILFFSTCNYKQESQQEVEKPKYGGTLRLLQDSPHSLDPLHMRNVYESTILNQIFNGLLELDDNLNIVPSIAKYWEISNDRKIYRFYLRDDVFFHNGRKVTAEDFVYTYKRILKFSLQDYFLGIEYLKLIEGTDDFLKNKSNEIKGLKVIDSLVLEIILTEECSPFLTVLSMNNFNVVPKEEIEKNSYFLKSPVGTGPFKVDRWEENDKIVLLANDNYFEGRPYLDTLIFYIPSHFTLDDGIDKFIRGELDVTFVSIKRYDELENSGEYEIIQRPELSILFLGINKAIPPFNDNNLRKAIFYAINSDSFNILYGTSKIASKSFIPPGLLGYDPSRIIKKYDLELAKKYLKIYQKNRGSSIPKLELYTIIGNSEEEINNNLKSIGLETEVKGLTWLELSKMLDAKKLPMFTLGWVADFPDPDAFFYSLVHSKGSANYFGLINYKIDKLLKLGRKEVNKLKRIEIYHKIEEELESEAVIVPLYYGVNTVAIQKNVKGFNISPLGFLNLNLHKVWKQK